MPYNLDNHRFHTQIRSTRPHMDLRQNRRINTIRRLGANTLTEPLRMTFASGLLRRVISNQIDNQHGLTRVRRLTRRTALGQINTHNIVLRLNSIPPSDILRILHPLNLVHQ